MCFKLKSKLLIHNSNINVLDENNNILLSTTNKKKFLFYKIIRKRVAIALNEFMYPLWVQNLFLIRISVYNLF